GLSARPIGEDEVPGRAAAVRAEQPAKPAAGRREAPAVTIEMEARGPRALLRAERLRERLTLGGREIEPDGPDVDVLRSHRVARRHSRQCRPPAVSSEAPGGTRW